MYRRSGRTADRRYASTLTMLGALCRTLGRYDQSEQLLREALDTHRRTVGEAHPEYAVCLGNLAFLYDLQGDVERAEPAYLRAVELGKKSLGEAHAEYGAHLNNLAGLYYTTGRLDEAERLYRQALDITRRLPAGERSPDFASCLNNLGGLYAERGQYERAEPFVRRGLQVMRLDPAAPEVTPEDLRPADLRPLPTTVKLLDNYTVLLRNRLGDAPTEEALRACDRACALAVDFVEHVRRSALEHEESKVLLASAQARLYARRLDVLAKLLRRRPDPRDAEAAFRTAELATARAFLEALGRSRGRVLGGVARELLQEEEQRTGALQLAEARLARAADRPPADVDAAAVQRLLEERRRAAGELDEIHQRMEREHPQYAELKHPRPPALAEARALLAKDEVALIFVLGDALSYVAVVDPAGSPGPGLSLYTLPGDDVLATAITPLLDPDALASAPRARALGVEAFQVVLGPAAERLRGKDLVIVPNGPLCHLPFELLVDDDGRYLIESRRVRYAPSLAAQRLARDWEKRRPRPDRELWAAGDPVYGDEAASVAPGRGAPPDRPTAPREVQPTPVTRSDTTFTRLVYSGVEVARLRELFGPAGATVLRREQVTEAAVKRAAGAGELARHRYVHFATHGTLGLDHRTQPALVLGRGGADGEDGFLGMDEVMALRLNADLVVLSACETGKGRLHNGEGVRGLARAFLYAGSRGVVCSLWQVDDRATSELMVHFYGGLRDGRPAADALRDAKLAMVRDGRAPLYWAPFVLVGE